jgi:putative peptide zinc metalloprotease protein
MELASRIAQEFAINGLRLRRAPDLDSQCIESAGKPLWVIFNPITSRYFHASRELYLTICRLDARKSTEQILAEYAEHFSASDDEMRDVALGLRAALAAGVLLSEHLRAMPPTPNPLIKFAGQTVFMRFHMGDMASTVKFLDPFIGWLFSRFGFFVLLIVMITAAISWSDKVADLSAQWVRLGQLQTQDILAGYLLFVFAKVLHELGHGIALRRMRLLEGLPDQSKPFGISFMFLMPAPYIDASSAWFLQKQSHRVVVGFAGVMTDLFLAAIAALIWSWAGPGLLKDRTFDLVLICGLSSLLFNMNPLARLDAYFVLSDLLGIPNLMQRAQNAFKRVILLPLGIAEQPAGIDFLFSSYFVLVWLYRWVIYSSVFWIAAGYGSFVLIIASAIMIFLFVFLPILQGARFMIKGFPKSPVAIFSLLSLIFIVTICIFFLPLRRSMIAEGVVVNNGLQLIYPRTDARVVYAAPAMIVESGSVLRLENPEMERNLIQLRTEQMTLDLEARRARAAGAQRLESVLARQAAVTQQIARLQAERDSWDIRVTGTAQWEPLFSEGLQESWVRRSEARPLGFLLSEGKIEIRLLLDQWQGPEALRVLSANPEMEISLRTRNNTTNYFKGRVIGSPTEGKDSLVSTALSQSVGGRIPTRMDETGVMRPNERIFEVTILPIGQDIPSLMHGARVEARIPLPSETLFAQTWLRLHQMIQRRLPV